MLLKKLVTLFIAVINSFVKMSDRTKANPEKETRNESRNIHFLLIICQE